MRNKFRMLRTGLTLLLVVIMASFVPIEVASASSKGGAGAYTIKKADGSGKMKPAYYSTEWKFQFPKDWEIEATVVDKKRNMMIVLYETSSKEQGLASYDLTTGERTWRISLAGIFEGEYQTFTEELEIQRNGEIFISGVIYKSITKTSESGHSYTDREMVSNALLTIQSSTGKVTRNIITPASNSNDFAEEGPWLLSDGRLMTASSLGLESNKTTLRYYDSAGKLLKTAERNGILMHFNNNEYVYLLKWDQNFTKYTIAVRDEADKVLRNYTYKTEQGKLKKNEVEAAWGTRFLPDGKFVVFADIYNSVNEQAPRSKRISVFSKHGRLLWMHNIAAPDRDSIYYTIIGDRLYVVDYKAATLAEINNGKMMKPVKLAKESLSEGMTVFADGTFYTEKLARDWSAANNKKHYYIGALKPIRNILQVTVPDHTRLEWTDSTQVLLYNYTNKQVSLLRVGK
ncbi:hypothetical protein NQ117_22035 [Paenibacillus sp. SC116]|nr:hypothetical protein [Paenibacillus sp. SC116]